MESGVLATTIQASVTSTSATANAPHRLPVTMRLLFSMSHSHRNWYFRELQLLKQSGNRLTGTDRKSCSVRAEACFWRRVEC
jgi:hypothetical protein